uniref:Alpha/beta hydrolase n=1 Tax=Ochrobactrum sp. PW1 TaxID=1882222 RepID=A0A292GI05_9HYPH|nr:alpha/beta hydrolase [Ochrobactrum sp. PW1]
MEARAGGKVPKALPLGKLRKQIGYMGNHGIEAFLRDIPSAETFCQRHDADGKRRPGHDVLGKAWGPSTGNIDQGDF